MRDDDVGAGPGHRHRFVRREDIRGRQHVERMGGCDHVDLEPVAHARLLEALPHRPVEQADRREVLDARKPHLLQLGQKPGHQDERVGSVDPGENRRVPDHGQDLDGHLLHDLVGIAVGKQAGRRAAPRHPVAAGIVDDDEVDAAGFLRLRGQAGTRAATDDRTPRLDGAAEFGQDRLAGNGGHGDLSVWRFAGRCPRRAARMRDR